MDSGPLCPGCVCTILVGALWVPRGPAAVGSLISSSTFSPKAADRLVCTHLPDGEATEEPVSEPRRAGGHPAGHPESRAAGHPGAAEDRVSQSAAPARKPGC